MARRAEPVVQFTDRPEPGPLRRTQDVLEALLGKIESLVDVLLLFGQGFTAYTVTNAALAPGTSLDFGEVAIDFADAGVDQVRLSVSGANSGAGTVIVTAYDKTNSVELCRVSVIGAASQCWIGEWTTIKPTGKDQVVIARVIGNGADDPYFYNIHIQGRTLTARA